MTHLMCTLLVLLLLTLASSSTAHRPLSAFDALQGPLFINGTRIFDSTGRLVQLRCANYPSHMETLLPEGVQWASVSDIAQLIVDSAVFNCIRLNYAVELFSSDAARTTARQRLVALNLTTHIAAIERHNPWLLELTPVQVIERFLDIMALYSIAVLADNTVSKASWCCSFTDGNGFFLDTYFAVQPWIDSLAAFARLSLRHPNVVALALRNELRSDTLSYQQQVDAWFRYVPVAIQAIHAVNPNALIVVSALSYDLDWTFLNASRAPNEWDRTSQDLSRVILFESHGYSWSGFMPADGNCTTAIAAMDKSLGYSYQHGHAMMMTEIGVPTDTYPSVKADFQFWQCISQFVLQKQLSFGIWLLGGSYLVRNGQPNFPDGFGQLFGNFSAYRNPEFLKTVQALNWMTSLQQSQLVAEY